MDIESEGDAAKKEGVLMEPMNVSDEEAPARASMEPATWDFYAGGSDDEVTLRANSTAFERIRLRPPGLSVYS